MTNLEAERRARGWSQTVLAFHAQLSQANISTFERGQAEPSPRQAERLARVLGVPADVLLREVREPNASVANAGAGRG